MKNSFIIIFLLTSSLIAGDIQVDLTLESRIFQNDGLQPVQKQFDAAAIFKLEYVHDFEDRDDRLAFTPFLRAQLQDDERSHFDIRELYWERIGTDWEFKLGVGQEYWGVTEFVHLINVINQVDSLESIDEEEKLGELMMKFTWLPEFGQFDFFILPGFRQREFPGEKGRLRFPFVIDGDDAEYESSREEKYVDFAMRYTQTFDSLDLGVSMFHGTQRDAQIRFSTTKNKMVPYYAKSTQLGVDAQYAWEDWLFKGEWMSRKIDKQEHNAFTGGVEYTLVRIFNTDMDLGLIGEGSWQNKRDQYSFFSDEIIFGQRLAFNNELGTEILSGVIYDVHHSSTLLSIEASTRLNNSIRLSVEGRIYQNIDNQDPLKLFEDEDYLNIECTWYF
jgi:hypothetical protein